MPTLVLDPPPAEIEALLERRRRLGQDRRDEMWEGVLHMAPAPLRRHARLQAQLAALLEPLARVAGLETVAEFKVLIVDPEKRSIDWLALDSDTSAYHAIEHSALIDLGPAELTGLIDWP